MCVVFQSLGQLFIQLEGVLTVCRVDGSTGELHQVFLALLKESLLHRAVVERELLQGGVDLFFELLLVVQLRDRSPVEPETLQHNRPFLQVFSCFVIDETLSFIELEIHHRVFEHYVLLDKLGNVDLREDCLRELGGVAL